MNDFLALLPLGAPLIGMLLVLALGFVVPQKGKVASSLVPPVAVIAAALVFGMVIHLWLAAASSPIDIAVGLWSTIPSAPVVLGVHVDGLSGVYATLAALVGLTMVLIGPSALGSPEPRTRSIVSRASPRDLAPALIALAALEGMTLSADLVVAGLFWALLLSLTVYVAAVAGDRRALIRLLILLGGGGILIGFATAMLTTAGNGGTLFAAGLNPKGAPITALVVVVIGFATALLAPFGVSLSDDPPKIAQFELQVIALPIAGFYLAARAITASGLLPVGIQESIGGLAILGLYLAGRSVLAAQNKDEVVLANGLLERALIGAAIAVETGPSMTAGVLLLAATTIAHLAMIADRRGSGSIVGPASILGLPPLPGFLGRGIILAAALGAGAWGLALVEVMVLTTVTSVTWKRGAWAEFSGESRERTRLGDPDWRGPLLSALLIVGALVPTLFLRQLFVSAGASFIDPTPLASSPLAEHSGLIVLLLAMAVGLALRDRPPVAKGWGRVSLGPTARLRRQTLLTVGRGADQISRFVAAIEDRYTVPVFLLLTVVAMFAFESVAGHSR